MIEYLQNITMAMEKVKNFILGNKEVLMVLVGFGVMHIGWYNLQRNDTLNKALAAGREKELIKVSLIRINCFLNKQVSKKYLFFIFKEYKRLEREINTNWPDQQQKSSEPQTTSVILTAANSITNK